MHLSFLIGVALIMIIGEMLSENIGLLVHSPQWSHVYSFFGYMVSLSSSGTFTSCQNPPNNDVSTISDFWMRRFSTYEGLHFFIINIT
jgi:hypothetical protein